MTDGLDMTKMRDLRCPICLYCQISRETLSRHLIMCAYDESYMMRHKKTYKPSWLRGEAGASLEAIPNKSFRENGEHVKD